MHDVVEEIGKSVIQHGKYSDRIYLMKLADEDFPAIIGQLDSLASSRGYSKIFAKVPVSAVREFMEDNYVSEALVPGFFNGREGAYFMGKYLMDARRNSCDRRKLEDIVMLAHLKAADAPLKVKLPPGYVFRMAGKSDVIQMADIYRQVFKTYPFPVHDPGYLSYAMENNTVFFCVCEADKIVALSSSEIDVEAQSTEMTDFATLPAHRRKGLAAFLLQRMEGEIQKMGIKTAYTIARAVSPGINIVFARSGYRYSGTLVNNTNIAGNLESMNVWYKPLLSPNRWSPIIDY